MKKVNSICLSALCTAFLLLGTLFACTGAAAAETAYSVDPDMPKTFWVGMDEETLTLRDKDYGQADIYKIEKANPADPDPFEVNVSEPYLNEKDRQIFDVYIRPVKAGKETFTIYFIDEDGNDRVMSHTFRAKNYPNEIKKLTVNGDVVKTAKKAVKPNGKKADTRFRYTVRVKGTRESIKIKLKKGWKISAVDSVLSRGAGDDIRDYKKVTKKSITKKTVTKGSIIYFPKNWDDLYVTVTMKNKTGDKIDYTVCFTRD